MKRLAFLLSAILLAASSFAATTSKPTNVQYALINTNTILNKSLGKRVKVMKYLDGTVKEIEGTILSTPENGLVLQTADGIVLHPSGEIQGMEMPQGLVPRPPLAWKLDSD